MSQGITSMWVTCPGPMHTFQSLDVLPCSKNHSGEARSQLGCCSQEVFVTCGASGCRGRSAYLSTLKVSRLGAGLLHCVYDMLMSCASLPAGLQKIKHDFLAVFDSEATYYLGCKHLQQGRQGLS